MTVTPNMCVLASMDLDDSHSIHQSANQAFMWVGAGKADKVGVQAGEATAAQRCSQLEAALLQGLQQVCSLKLLECLSAKTCSQTQGPLPFPQHAILHFACTQYQHITPRAHEFSGTHEACHLRRGYKDQLVDWLVGIFSQDGTVYH